MGEGELGRRGLGQSDNHGEAREAPEVVRQPYRRAFDAEPLTQRDSPIATGQRVKSGIFCAFSKRPDADRIRCQADSNSMASP
jgi:hypothetical protein